MSNFRKLHLTHKIFRILPVFSLVILVKFGIHFLGLPWEIAFDVITEDYNIVASLAPKKCKKGCNITTLAFEKCKKKKNAICFKLFWYKVFVHWKLKLLNFLVDSVLVCL